VINHSYHGWFYANKSTSTSLPRNQVLLSWNPPPPGILKLNIDGSRICTTGHIAAGGLLRNCHGDWIGGFSANLGIGEIFTAELWSLYYGLKLALQLNCNRIQVESDSSLVVNLVKGQSDDTHPLHGLISDCKNLLLGNWECSFNHVYRECNNAADGLARMGHAMNLGWHVLVNSPPNLLDRLADDCNGRIWPRIVIA
jgi:ribonuclease HI